MKHLFLVHSHITWLVTKLIIDYKRLEQDDVIIILEREYSIVSCDYETMVFPLFDLEDKSSKHLLTRSQKHLSVRIKKWQTEFDNHIKSEFFIYLPHTYNHYFQMAVSTKLCLGFFYIEEGLAGYDIRNFKSEEVKLFTLLSLWCKWKNLGLVKLYLSGNYFNLAHRKYRGAYSLDEGSFMAAKNRIKLDIYKLRESYTQPTLIDAECIIIFDALSIYGRIKSERILKITSEIIIPFVKANYDKVMLKLHPEHYLEKGMAEAESIKRIFTECDVNFELMDRDFILETYLLYHKIPIICFVSSIGIYADMLQSKVYSVYNHLASPNSKWVILPTTVANRFKTIN